MCDLPAHLVVIIIAITIATLRRADGLGFNGCGCERHLLGLSAYRLAFSLGDICDRVTADVGLVGGIYGSAYSQPGFIVCRGRYTHV